MNDLPSREQAAAIEIRVGEGGARIIRAYAEGRLVDREAIDYEAATKVIESVDEDTVWVADILAAQVVVAAIGDTE